uniref:Uncharacterized protein n=1 Tax=uncultured bacterium contig00024 TaxID=1181513 RepID=A0A806KH17_9BACT|nr:hypothetical protein [uncultured bacterium contig00024]
MKKTKGADLINSLIEKSLEARKSYLRIDVYVRAKKLLTEDYYNASAESKSTEFMHLGKRIGIIKSEWGEEEGNKLIQEALDYLIKDLGDEKQWTGKAKQNIECLETLLNMDDVKILEGY